jgi:hypothetical protein
MVKTMGIINKTMKGYEYVHYMTLKEWKKWEENVRNQDGKEGIKRWLNEDYTSFNSFIANSFTWRIASPDSAYWVKICNRTAPLTDSKEKVK